MQESYLVSTHSTAFIVCILFDSDGHTRALAAATGTPKCRRLQWACQSVAERSHPTSEVRGRSWEDPMPKGWRPRGVTPRPRSGRVANRRYPASEVRGSDERRHQTSEVRVGDERRYPVSKVRGGDERRYPMSEVRGGDERSYTMSEVRGGEDRSYPESKVRGSGREELPHAPRPEARGDGWRSYPTPLSPRQRVAAGRNNPMTKARGGGQEDQPHVQRAVAARAQEGLEELSHIEGQEGRW